MGKIGESALHKNRVKKGYLCAENLIIV